ncbi:hypothetical protein F1D05_18010 [Kribbella qitaiheensis]|uniref:Uncharacterized protein n=1 Tax=Kribbella qitaiheensis TaxID=1544730 RepID=A0A7G6WZP7_9ACTN|nr:hypothetical protein [Kribbella qitaiheensis]QNE19462.1 hypothetical protein F1D05_18010 [Kribbella qitaiheensis]
MNVARGGIGRALLGSGLLAVTLLGGAGGYGIGLLTSAASEVTGQAVPLGLVTPTTPVTTQTPTKPPRTATPDNTKPLDPDDLSYQTRTAYSEQVVRSRITVNVPRNWWLSHSDPPQYSWFSDPTRKRKLRIEAGFSVTRPPAASMAERVGILEALSADRLLTILDQKIDAKARTATLTYTYIPENETSLRRIMVRWVATDDSGNVGVELSSIGLPQDKDAILDVLDHASESVTRSDSEL